MDRRHALACLSAIVCAGLLSTSAAAQRPASTQEPATADEALLAAVDRRDRKQAEELLRMGADPNARNKRGMTVLQMAVVRDSLPLAELLVAKGASINAKSTQAGASPLAEAAYWGHTALVRYLIGKGADVHSRLKDGGTPLIAAAYPGHRDAMQVLIQNGADVNARNNYGDTPLSMAVRGRNNGAAVKLLLESGANPATRNNEGKTPLDLATIVNNADVLQLLRKHGAK
jgi:ankyrin repeat protein